MKKKIICFAEDWGGLPSSSQHLAKGLLDNGWQILWINSIGLREPRIRLVDLKRLFQKLKSFLFSNKTRELSQEKYAQLKILSPLTLPFFGSSLIDKINRFILGKQITSIMRNNQLDDFIVLASFPTAVAYYPLLNKHKWVYYCCDDFSALANVSHDKVVKCEKKLMQRVSSVVVASEALKNKFASHDPIVVEHGVDLLLFKTKMSRPTDLPKKGPVVLFYGSISSWLDWDLIEFISRQLHDFNFVFIGVIATDVSRFNALNNVLFLGYKDHSLLPAYLQHCQVAILPFKCNQQILGCSPLKLKEYLASGSYVVSTSFPASREFSEVLHIAETKAHFLQYIEEFDSDTAELRAKRQKAVDDMSWVKQASLLEQKLLDE